jgi:D-serine deaminase-like pyridoxal phosphate-dependent protein
MVYVERGRSSRMKASLLGFEIVKPTLLLDKQRVLKNIETMAGKAKASGVRFRPHFKTHQSAEIGDWFRDFGVEAITVSSLDMARYFADNGWTDITVAFIVNLSEIDKINHLADRINLNLLVDSQQVLSDLDKKLKHTVGMWIKVDTAYHRTGVAWDDFDTIRTLAQRSKDSPRLNFRGLLTHAGHAYKAADVSGILKIHVDTLLRMAVGKEHLEMNGIDACEISIGDTPTCSLVDDFTGVDEIRPGNFVFYDLMQEKLQTCTEDQIAIAVACPVVGKYKDRNQIVIYGGAVHLSMASIPDKKGQPIFGYLTSLQDGTFGPINRNAPVISLSQEHGIIQVTDDTLRRIEIGDLLLVFPVHSCLTCDRYDGYRILKGDVISRRR